MSEIKNIRLLEGISDSRNGYRPRTNIIKNEKGDFFCRLPYYFG